MNRCQLSYLAFFFLFIFSSFYLSSLWMLFFFSSSLQLERKPLTVCESYLCYSRYTYIGRLFTNDYMSFVGQNHFYYDESHHFSKNAMLIYDHMG